MVSRSLTRRPILGAALATMLIASSACAGGSAATPTAPAKVTAPTTAPTTTGGVSPSPTTAAKPAASPSPAVSPPPAASPAAVATPATSPVAQAQAPNTTRLEVSSFDSEIRYRAQEQLVGQSLPGQAVGSTKDVSGAIVLGADGRIVREQSKVTVDLRTLRSDESRRDNYIQRSTLRTSEFPNAELVPTSVTGLPTPLPTSGEASFQLLGDLTVHGVTKPTTWQVTARFDQSRVAGTATTEVKMTNFGMTPPQAGPVLSIEDALKLEMDFTATRGA
jgi:polyisoprenoid-binding protein YceI